MTILNLPSVMQLCNEFFDTNLLKLNSRMSRSINSRWPKKIMLIGQAIFSQCKFKYLSQKYPQNRCYTVSLENCFFLCVSGLKLTLYLHISEDAASVHAVIVFYFETLLDAK